MTNEEAILILRAEWRSKETGFPDDEVRDALDMAIKALYEKIENYDKLLKSGILDCVKEKAEPCEDCISRKAALNVIDGEAWRFCDTMNPEDYKKHICIFSDNLRDRVKEMPSVKLASTESCTTTESSTDCISRKHFDSRVRAAGGMVEEDLTDDFKDGVLAALDMLKTEPSVTPERKTGKWIDRTSGFTINLGCDQCGKTVHEYGCKFCPNCGAEMEVETDDRS